MSAADLTDTDALWSAVVSRDPESAGHFYYGVLTTGVYSVPTCTARRARRRNVRFFATRAAAEEAGFRPCGRCRPADGPEQDEHLNAVAAACRLIARDPGTALGDLAGAVGFSRFHFHRMFRTTLGTTPRGYASAHRAQRLRAELTGSSGVTDAVYQAGYQSISSFYASSRDILGMSPTHYRTGAPGTVVRVGHAVCGPDAVMVATTDQGICAAATGPCAATLVDDLARRFPLATAVPDPGLSGRIASILADLTGTALAGLLDADLLLPAVAARIGAVDTAAPESGGIVEQRIGSVA